MDFNGIITAISTVGFPIVCCCLLVFYFIKQSNNHKEESAKMAEALNNNTLVMHQILEHLRGVRNDL